VRIDVQQENATVFYEITQDMQTLADFLHSLSALEAPWETEFQKRYCKKCLHADCDAECPNAAFRDNPAWWLALPAAETEL